MNPLEFFRIILFFLIPKILWYYSIHSLNIFTGTFKVYTEKLANYSESSILSNSNGRLILLLILFITYQLHTAGRGGDAGAPPPPPHNFGAQSNKVISHMNISNQTTTTKKTKTKNNKKNMPLNSFYRNIFLHC